MTIKLFHADSKELLKTLGDKSVARYRKGVTHGK
jgi:hypothetical protein